MASRWTGLLTKYASFGRLWNRVEPFQLQNFYRKAVSACSSYQSRRFCNEEPPKNNYSLNVEKKRTPGQKGLDRAIQKLTLEHESKPDDSELIETPKGFRVELEPYKKQALRWMAWRESQPLSGGILAHEMGMGKTSIVIAKLVHDKNEREKIYEEVREEENRNDLGNALEESSIPSHISLIVVPTGSLDHLKSEFERTVDAGVLSILWLDSTRMKIDEIDAQSFVAYDVVIASTSCMKKKPLSIFSNLDFYWKRVILLNAEEIDTQDTGVLDLQSKSRWCVTDRPVKNYISDLWTLLRFLKVSSHFPLTAWSPKDTVLYDKTFNLLLRNIILTRKKEDVCSVTNKPLFNLPTLKWIIHEVRLTGAESYAYDKHFARAKFEVKQLLGYGITEEKKRCGNSLFKNDNGESFVFVWYLKMRLAGVHPYLIKGEFHEDAMKEISRYVELRHATPSEDIFSEDYVSAKSRKLLEIVDDCVNKGEKAIIMSQSCKALQLMERLLLSRNHSLVKITGKVGPCDRLQCVHSLNERDSSPGVLLYSAPVKSRGMKLNTVTNVIDLDLHWNEHRVNRVLESIYHEGQQKGEIVVHRLMATEPIERRVLELSDRKAKLCEQVLYGNFHSILLSFPSVGSLLQSRAQARFKTWLLNMSASSNSKELSNTTFTWQNFKKNSLLIFAFIALVTAYLVVFFEVIGTLSCVGDSDDPEIIESCGPARFKASFLYEVGTGLSLAVFVLCLAVVADNWRVYYNEQAAEDKKLEKKLKKRSV